MFKMLKIDPEKKFELVDDAYTHGDAVAVMFEDDSVWVMFGDHDLKGDREIYRDLSEVTDDCVHWNSQSGKWEYDGDVSSNEVEEIVVSRRTGKVIEVKGDKCGFMERVQQYRAAKESKEEQKNDSEIRRDIQQI